MHPPSHELAGTMGTDRGGTASVGESWSAMTPTRDYVAALIDHTLLAPEAAVADVTNLCHEAASFGVHAVCISPSMVDIAASELMGLDVKIASVTGFPSGAHITPIKVDEAARAVDDGADEIDMVLNLSNVSSGNWHDVEMEIVSVRRVVPSPKLLKVILETAILSDDAITTICHVAVASGVDFVKTSTGFHRRGGATEHAVRVMSRAVNGLAGVKASGGIRTTQQALGMLAAGATRLGLSHTREVLEALG